MVRSRPLATLLLSLALSAITLAAASGGVLRVAVPYALTTLDPYGTNSLDLATTTAALHIFDTLVTREGDTFRPSVAASWSNPDPTTWTFELRDDVTFSNGEPLTAADVVASIDRYVSQDGPAAALFAPVTASANGDHEVVMKTESPFGTLLGNLTRMFIAPADALANADFGTAPIGSGPFVVKSFSVDDTLVLTANASYWGGRPSLDGLDLVRIPEVSSRLTALQTGEIDLTWLIPADQLPGLESDPNLTVDSVPSYSSYVIWFNASKPPFDNVLVRRAVWHAIDFGSIIDNLYQGIGVAADAPVTPQVFGYAPQIPYTYDPELAKSLLAQAGYPDGFETSILWKNDEYSDLSYAVISDLSKVGIKVTPRQEEHAIWIQDLLALNWDINNMVQAATTGDADILLGRLYMCDAKRIGYCNPALDDLLQQARTEADQSKRQELYAQASKIIWEDAVGMYPIDLLATYALRDRVKNFHPAASFAPSFTSVTLDN